MFFFLIAAARSSAFKITRDLEFLLDVVTFARSLIRFLIDKGKNGQQGCDECDLFLDETVEVELVCPGLCIQRLYGECKQSKAHNQRCHLDGFLWHCNLLLGYARLR